MYNFDNKIDKQQVAFDESFRNNMDVRDAKRDYPVVPCVHEFTDRSGVRRVKLVCPYCHKVHRHGSGKTFGEADGEFRSNCGGYYLKEVSNPTLAGFSPDFPGAYVM